MSKNTSVIGIYPDRTTVSEAISVLQKTGYRSADIAVLSAENQGSKDFAHEKSSKAPQGAAAGAAAGAVTCAILAWCVSAGVFAIPGMEPFAAVRPFMAAMAGAGCGGTLGWLLGFILGMSVPEYVAKRYAGRMGRGGILLSVHCDSPEWRQRAEKSLKDTGARYISSASESAADYATTDRPTPREPVGVLAREPVGVLAREPVAVLAGEPVVVLARDEVRDGRPLA